MTAKAQFIVIAPLHANTIAAKANRGLSLGRPRCGQRAPTVRLFSQATAALAPRYTSAGIVRRSRQVIAIGRSPSCDT